MKAKNKIRAFAVALAVGCTAMNGYGAESSVLPGWDSDFIAVTNRAITAHKPIVMIWANTGCEYCEELEADVRKADFVKWREASNYEFCFVLGVNGKDPDGAKGAKQFARTAGGTHSASSDYPFECLYWAKRDGTIVAERFARSTGDQLRQMADRLFADYVPVPDYLGGDLAFTGDYAHARLEAELGFTRYVDVVVERAGEAVPFVGTNTVTAVYNASTILSQRIAWAAGESKRSIRVNIPVDVPEGGAITVNLADDVGAQRGSVKIYLVGEQENSTKNPFYLGEKTKDTLGYGEWTMDLDVAMEKFNAEPESRLMAIASGSLWCPDCVMTDGHVLENPAFKTWAVENKVILVDIDVPNFGPNEGNSACLLTKVVGRTSDGYISGRGTLATNELERFQSGAGYLSRHMVGDSSAAAVLARNRSLIGRNTLQGGWNDPNRANQNRTGIPNFFALRRDGSVAGTFETFDAIGPSEYNEAYLKRFSELIALCDGDDSEFANRSWQTTEDEFAGEGAAVAGTLSAIDLKDTYKLAPTTAVASSQMVTVRGSDAGATITVSLISVVNGEVKTLDTVTGRLSDGLSVTGVISSTGDYYVSIVGAGEGTLAADSTAASTVTAYTITGTRAPIANPFTNEWTTKAATTTLPLYAADGVTLKGTLALTLKKTGKISAKYTNGKSSVAIFSGAWDDDIAADGTATAEMEKKGWTLSLEMTADGVIAAEVTDGTTTLASCDCGLAENYGEFAGVYTVALPALDSSATMQPSGNAIMTLKMLTSSSAKKRGAFSYKVYLPNGKTLSGSSNVTWIDANFGIVPVLKTSSVNTFAATLMVRKNASSAASARAIVALEGTSAVWTDATRGNTFTRRFGVYGSWYDKKGSFLTGIEDESLTLAFTPDTTSVAASPTYGALQSVTGNGAKIQVTDAKITVPRVQNFTFKVTKSTGVVSGTMKLNFAGKSNLSAKFTGVLLRGWFSECDCGEDADPLIDMENVAFATGHCLFVDKVNKKSVKRSFPFDVKSE